MEINGKRVAYHLDLFEKHPTREGAFRVLLVTENEPGYSRMGDETRGQTPWYWDETTCAEENRKLGYTPRDVAWIIASSMRGPQAPKAKKL